MKFAQRFAAKLPFAIAGLIVALLVGVAMFTVFPGNYPWINLIPSAITWVVITPLMERRAVRLRERKPN